MHFYYPVRFFFIYALGPFHAGERFPSVILRHAGFPFPAYFLSLQEFLFLAYFHSQAKFPFFLPYFEFTQNFRSLQGFLFLQGSCSRRGVPDTAMVRLQCAPTLNYHELSSFTDGQTTDHKKPIKFRWRRTKRDGSRKVSIPTTSGSISRCPDEL